MARVQLVFALPDAIDDTWSLVYVYPERRESREWPFTLERVPFIHVEPSTRPPPGRTVVIPP